MTEIINEDIDDEFEDDLDEGIDEGSEGGKKEVTDAELEAAGDDPVKLKELLKKRTDSRQRLYKRLKKAEADKKEKGKKGDDDDEDTSKKGKKGEVVLDKADRAILRTEKITSEDEVELVKRIMKETGKDVEGVIASKYFKTELKELRDEAEQEEATPSNTRRSSNSNRNSVDYWITKGELPPMNQPELRQKVVNAKIAAEKSRSQFSSTPIS